MKKLITAIFLLSIFGLYTAQAGEVYFEETFPTKSLGNWKTVDGDQKAIHAEARQVLAQFGITALQNFSWDVGQIATNPANYAAFSTSYYSPAAAADDWLISPEIEIGEVAILEWTAAALNASYADGYKVYISTTDDAVESFDKEIFSINAEQGYLVRRFVDLAALGYKNQKIHIAFRNVSYNKLCLVVDDIKVWTPTDYDLVAVELNLDKYYKVSSSGIPISFYVQNLGYKELTSFDVTYQADGEEPVTATIQNPNINYLADGIVTHPVKWVPTELGDRTVKVWLSNVNGVAENDVNNANDTIVGSTYVWDNSIAKDIFPLYESFTSATCGPCYSVNTRMNPILQNNKESIAVVKYQMNWPGSGDIYYTAEGGVRRGYYNINSVPIAFANGQLYEFTQENLSQVGIDKIKNMPGFFDIQNPAYVVKDRKVKVEADIKPLSDFTGKNLVAHIAVIELTTYNNRASNGETEFHNVMKKMLPNAYGTVVTALEPGESQKLYYTYEFPTNSTVEEYEDLAVVIWVQDNDSKSVLEAGWAVKSTTLDVPYENDGNGIVAVFPNPTSELAKMRYSVKGEQNVKVELFSIDGNLIYGEDYGIQSEGYYIEDFNVANLASGQYLVKLTIGDRVFSDKINVVR